MLPNYLLNFSVDDYSNRFLLFDNLDSAHKPLIKKHFRHYNALSDRDKLLFEKRVQKFINMKEFIPKGGLEVVTDEMKVLIACTAIQITFGYPGVYFSHFKQILLYPDKYYSNVTKMHHHGEVNMKGVIVLSWANFMKGLNNTSNGINLGFHEMTHALKLENALQNDEYNFIDYDSLLAFTRKSVRQIEKIKTGENVFFRKYAATNTHEFMAVVVENFFERPKELREHDEHLYELTTKLLKQDPLKRNDRYSKG